MVKACTAALDFDSYDLLTTGEVDAWRQLIVMIEGSAAALDIDFCQLIGLLSTGDLAVEHRKCHSEVCSF